MTQKRRIPDRLTKVDSRVSKIFRRLGFLTARFYFKPVAAADYTEVEIFEHQDSGINAKNWKTGSEVSGHRHTVKVSADWWRLQSGEHGTYGLSIEDGAILPCELEGATFQDDDTAAALQLRIIQSVNTYE